MRGTVNLGSFDNAWYNPGRGVVVRAAWLATSAFFFLGWFPWPSGLKRWLLRRFGAKVGSGVVFKPHINIKYPWHLEVGDYSWLGEGVWLDSLATIRIGAHVCVSQGAMIETGNHDWSRSTFDLILRPVLIEDGAWVAVKALMLPGSRLATHAVLGSGSVLSGDTEPYRIYSGAPARIIQTRNIEPEG